MGGSGGRSRSFGDLGALEETVKQELKKAAGQGSRNVFISFAYEDVDDVNLLRGQAKNENTDFEFHDWSVKEPFDSARAEYIRSRIRERIRQASVSLIYVSDHTASSKWVDWEIRESIRLGKAVVAVHKGDSPPRALPASLKEFSIRPIKWTHKGLADAIEGAAQKHDGDRD